jgi:hypothetical protein
LHGAAHSYMFDPAFLDTAVLVHHPMFLSALKVAGAFEPNNKDSDTDSNDAADSCRDIEKQATYAAVADAAASEVSSYDNITEPCCSMYALSCIL